MAKGLKDLPPIGQAAVMALVAVVLVGGGFYYYVYPLFGQRASLQANVNQLKAENERNRAFEQKLTDYRIAIEDQKNQLKTLRLLVPDQPAVDQVMKTVFGLADSSAIHVRTFLPQAVAPKDFYSELPFKLRLDGTYWAMVDFFDRVARQQRIMSVTSIQLGSPTGGGMGAYEVGARESVGANCTLTTYFGQGKPATPQGPGTAQPPGAPAHY